MTKNSFTSSFGHERSGEWDKREMCPYCKNEFTTRINDAIELAPYIERYGGAAFKAMSCHCCRGKWHFATEGCE